MINLIFMLKKIVLTVFLSFLLGGFLFDFCANPASAQEGNYGLDSTAGQIDAFEGQVGTPLPENFIQTRAGQVIGFILSLVGILFLGLMIYAGLLWMTAQGNEQKVEKAKNLLINAVIGLIIVFAAYAITAFVGEFVSKELLNSN